MTEISPNSLANLRPAWAPGQSANPAGKPKGIRNRSTIVKEILDLKHETGETYEYVATKAVADKAASGDVQAWDKLMDAAHGKVPDKTELTGAEGGPVQISSSDEEVLALYRQKIIDDYVKSNKS